MAETLDEFLFLFARLNWQSVVDILLVTAVIYGLLVLVRGTQAVVLLRGIIFLAAIVALLTTFLRLTAFSWLLRSAFPALLISVPVIFAPEIRRGLERLGRASALLSFTTRPDEVQQVITAITTTATRLSERRHGGLIVIERQVGLKNYADSGVALNAQVTVELLMQIFYPNTPLHDGAVIIKEQLVVAAACVMPLPSGENAIPDRHMGLRHRAALGISEVSDAVAVVISEETGNIAVAYNGRMLQRLDQVRLKHILTAFYRPRAPRSLRQLFQRRAADDQLQKDQAALGE
jgi:diadenylate cyclase